MKVFISWSGEKSKKIAEALRSWMPTVIQALKPYFTPDDVSKGSRWFPEISIELEQSKIGILCLTKDNLNSPWILFEAGALSKNLDKSKVCPILFGIESTDITGPLVQFQATKFEKDEIKKMLIMINNELNENKLASEVLNNVYDMWWPRLRDKIDIVINEETLLIKKPMRSEREILEEILELSRSFTKKQFKDNQKEGRSRANALTILINDLSDLFLVLGNTQTNIEIQNSVKKLLESLEQISIYFDDWYSDELMEAWSRIAKTVPRLLKTKN